MTEPLSREERLLARLSKDERRVLEPYARSHSYDEISQRTSLPQAKIVALVISGSEKLGLLIGDRQGLREFFPPQRAASLAHAMNDNQLTEQERHAARLVHMGVAEEVADNTAGRGSLAVAYKKLGVKDKREFDAKFGRQVTSRVFAQSAIAAPRVPTKPEPVITPAPAPAPTPSVQESSPALAIDVQVSRPITAGERSAISTFLEAGSFEAMSNAPKNVRDNTLKRVASALRAWNLPSPTKINIDVLKAAVAVFDAREAAAKAEAAEAPKVEAAPVEAIVQTEAVPAETDAPVADNTADDADEAPAQADVDATPEETGEATPAQDPPPPPPVVKPTQRKPLTIALKTTLDAFAEGDTLEAIALDQGITRDSAKKRVYIGLDYMGFRRDLNVDKDLLKEMLATAIVNIKKPSKNVSALLRDTLKLHLQGLAPYEIAQKTNSDVGAVNSRLVEVFAIAGVHAGDSEGLEEFMKNLPRLDTKSDADLRKSDAIMPFVTDEYLDEDEGEPTENDADKAARLMVQKTMSKYRSLDANVQTVVKLVAKKLRGADLEVQAAIKLHKITDDDLREEIITVAKGAFNTQELAIINEQLALVRAAAAPKGAFPSPSR